MHSQAISPLTVIAPFIQGGLLHTLWEIVIELPETALLWAE